MSTIPRHLSKGVTWNIPGYHDAENNVLSGVDNDHAQLAVLMDLRDELKRLNALLHCPNFIGMPAILRQVAANTKKARRRRKVKK